MTVEFRIVDTEYWAEDQKVEVHIFKKKHSTPIVHGTLFNPHPRGRLVLNIYQNNVGFRTCHGVSL